MSRDVCPYCGADVSGVRKGLRKGTSAPQVIRCASCGLEVPAKGLREERERRNRGIRWDGR